jgi:flavin reductase (DIM6/NTAB) family NADH-FMN oxidoreductase RutF
MRAARRRWATGVTIVTSVDVTRDELLFTGATVSAFTVLSLDPPLVLIALETGSTLARTITESNIFAVSILDRLHEAASDRFSGYGPRPDGRFTGIPHEVAVSGCPVLAGSLAWFDCLVESLHEAGDHLAIHGRVVALGIGPDSGDPLLNYEGAYRRLEGA